MGDFDIRYYIKEAEEIEKLYSEFIDACDTNAYNNTVLSVKVVPLQRKLIRKYEVWYSVVKRIVTQYTEQFNLFINQYKRIKELFLLEFSFKRETYLSELIDVFDIQVNILHTVLPIIALKETNFKKVITADLLNSELEQAEFLYGNNYYRPAGAIAGVVLERYLKTLCEVNKIPIMAKDTIDPLAIKLYKLESLPNFNLVLLKSVQHLASIRNKCTHPKEDIKEEEVRELIDKVKKITFLGI